MIQGAAALAKWTELVVTSRTLGLEKRAREVCEEHAELKDGIETPVTGASQKGKVKIKFRIE
jgi:hypothetical protein